MPRAVLYCPKCARPFDTSGETRRCVAGDMPLSQSLDARLDDDFRPGSVAVPARPLAFEVGGTWFCPSDASQLVEAGGIVGCPSCGRSINHLIFTLVELHPHRPVAPA